MSEFAIDTFNNKFMGFFAQGSRPTPPSNGITTGSTNQLWARSSDNHLIYSIGNTDFDLCAGGGSTPKLQAVYDAGGSTSDSVITTDDTRQQLVFKDGRAAGGAHNVFAVQNGSSSALLQVTAANSTAGAAVTIKGDAPASLNSTVLAINTGVSYKDSFATLLTLLDNSSALAIWAHSTAGGWVQGSIEHMTLSTNVAGTPGAALFLSTAGFAVFSNANTGVWKLDMANVKFTSLINNGGSAIAFKYDTTFAYTTTSKLVSWSNNGTEKAFIDNAGIFNGASTMVLGSITLNPASPSIGDVLTYDGSAYVPQAPSGGGSITNPSNYQAYAIAQADSNGLGTFSDIGDGSSTGFADWTTPSVSSGNYLLFWFVQCFSTLTFTLGEFQAVVDGSAPAGQVGGFGTTNVAHTPVSGMAYLGALSSATHTIKLQWKDDTTPLRVNTVDAIRFVLLKVS